MSHFQNRNWGNDDETIAMGANNSNDGYDHMGEDDGKGSKGWTELIAQYSPFGTRQKTSTSNERDSSSSILDMSISSSSSLLHSSTVGVDGLGMTNSTNIDTEDRDKTIRKFTYQNQNC